MSANPFFQVPDHVLGYLATFLSGADIARWRSTCRQLFRSKAIAKELAEHSVVSLAAGCSHSLFLKNNGDVFASGDNTRGQLGSGNVAKQSIPAQITFFKEQGIKIIKIVAGAKHSIFLTHDGIPYVAGSNKFGQLAIGNLGKQHTPVPITFFVEQGIRVTHIAAGNSHSLFLAESGLVYSAGKNSDGQLGIGSWVDQNTPTLVSIYEPFEFSTARVANFAAGAQHSLFLTEGGTVFSAGQGRWGQLGLHDEVNRNTPVRISYFQEQTHKITHIAAGSHHSLFLTEDGIPFTAGWNIYGQLGLGYTSFSLGKHRLRHLTNKIGESTPMPVPFFQKNNLIVTEIAGGWGSALFRVQDGTYYAVGMSFHLPFNRNPSTPVPFSQDLKVTQVAEGYRHALTLTKSGQVFAAGWNEKGQLGVGHEDDARSAGSLTLASLSVALQSKPAQIKHVFATTGSTLFENVRTRQNDAIHYALPKRFREGYSRKCRDFYILFRGKQAQRLAQALQAAVNVEDYQAILQHQRERFQPTSKQQTALPHYLDQNIQKTLNRQFTFRNAKGYHGYFDLVAGLIRQINEFRKLEEDPNESQVPLNSL